MNPILEIEDVTCLSRSKVRLKDINLSIYPKEKVALIGQSGAGKSTLIEIANGSCRPNKGSVRWKGIEINKLNRLAKQKIGTVWQDLRLVDELTVAQNINSGALGRHNIWWAIRNLASLLNYDLCSICLRAVDLDASFKNANIKILSGGQQQRVAIARLIRQQPELLLADEPLSNLDPRLVQKTLNLLLNKIDIGRLKMPSTSMISLHRPELTKGFTRIIGLKNGSILFDIARDDLTENLLNQLYKKC